MLLSLLIDVNQMTINVPPTSVAAFRLKKVISWYLTVQPYECYISSALPSLSLLVWVVITIIYTT
jgi:hypothetical protein